MSREISIGQYENNSGIKCNYIKGLQAGDEIVAKVTSKGLLDVGMSGMTLDFDEFIQGKTYIVDHVSRWDFELVAWVKDEDNCLHIVKPEIFEIPNF